MSVNKHPTFDDALWELVLDNELICHIESEVLQETRRRLIQKGMTSKNDSGVRDGYINKKRHPRMKVLCGRNYVSLKRSFIIVCLLTLCSVVCDSRSASRTQRTESRGPLVSIRHTPTSCIDPDIDCTHLKFPWFYSVHPGRFLGSSLNIVAILSFQIISEL